MLSYNPGVYDRSGEIISQGAQNAAMLNMEAMSDMGENMGQVLTTFAEAYKQKEQDKSDAKIYGQLLKFVAPAFGQEGDAVLAEYNTLKSDRDKANYGRTISQLLGPASNAMMARGRLGVQQNQPFVNAGLDNAANIAAGKGTYIPGGGGNQTIVEPEDPLPAVTAPGPVANPVTDASRQRAMQWWQKRSQGGP